MTAPNRESSEVEDQTAQALREKLTKVEAMLRGDGEGLPSYRTIAEEQARIRRVLEGEKGTMNKGVVPAMEEMGAELGAMSETLTKIEGHLATPPKKPNGATDWKTLLLSPQTAQMGASLIVILLFVVTVISVVFGFDVIGFTQALRGGG